MKLIIKEVDKFDIENAEKYFWNNFCEKLKIQKTWNYNENLVSRYLIKKNKNNFSSISHKKDLVFIWTNNSKIWVDIEYFKYRDKNLLDKFYREEYMILWKKSWKKFYILWTAKESIIKYENLILDNIEEIILEKSENINLEIDKINFSKKLLLKLWNKYFEVYSWNKLDLYYSFCVKF